MKYFAYKKKSPQSQVEYYEWLYYHEIGTERCYISVLLDTYSLEVFKFIMIKDQKLESFYSFICSHLESVHLWLLSRTSLLLVILCVLYSC